MIYQVPKLKKQCYLKSNMTKYCHLTEATNYNKF